MEDANESRFIVMHLDAIALRTNTQAISQTCHTTRTTLTTAQRKETWRQALVHLLAAILQRRLCATHLEQKAFRTLSTCVSQSTTGQLTTASTLM
jgi:hypothetical protein